AAAALVLEVREERDDRGRVEILEHKLGWRLPGPLVQERQQQPEAVAVGGDRVRAGVALAGETIGEERLQQRRQRGHRGPSQLRSSRSAASAKSSGAFSMYQ